MKKLIALCLALILLTCAWTGCKRDLNYIIQHKPHFSGIVEEVHDAYIVVSSTTMDGYPNGANCYVSLNTAYEDSSTAFSVGDGVTVYYDGDIMETDPLQFEAIYAIFLIDPANREANDPS